jgi:hypothetical protein
MPLKEDMDKFCQRKPTWKGDLYRFLTNEINLVQPDFVGEVTVSIGQLGVRFISKSETIK